MSPEIISAGAAVVAALVSIIAVSAAFRSASASEKSAEAAAKTLHRAAVRELITLCYEVIAEDLRIHSIWVSMRSEITDLGVFSGTSGGSAETNLRRTVDDYLASTVELVKEAHSIGDDHSRLYAASDTDLDKKSARLGAVRVKVRAIREAIERQLIEAQTMNQAYRAKRM